MAAPPELPIAEARAGLDAGHFTAAELTGADAVLFGTSLMQAPDRAARLRDLIARPLVKVCGLTRQEGCVVCHSCGYSKCS